MIAKNISKAKIQFFFNLFAAKQWHDQAKFNP